MKQKTTNTTATSNQHVRDLIDEVCDQFESEWAAGKQPDLVAYLEAPAVPTSHHSALAKELLAMDVEYREAQGETPRARDYLAHLDGKYRAAIEHLFPAMASSDTVCIDADLSIAKFTADLASSGLVDEEQLARYQHPRVSNTTANQLARDMVDAGVLTPYQANLVAAGDAGKLVFGQYTILDELGKGGMGVVYRALHRRMHREVAIKVLPPTMLDKQEAVDRFYREVQAAAKLMHPNIVTAFDADEHDGSHYLVMEFIKGEDLSHVLARRGPLPISEAVNYTIQAARGLQFAHEKNLIHRDIKPANLLLDESGSVKILDMGLARIREDGLGNQTDSKTPQLTQSGQIMGTVDYMAPEQAEDVRTADHRADVYSLGCTMHRLLTGKTVFKGDTLLQRILAHRSTPPPSLKSFRPQVSDELDAVFRKMIAKQADARQQSMHEVIGELQACPLPDGDEANAATCKPLHRREPARAAFEPTASISSPVASTETINAPHKDTRLAERDVKANQNVSDRKRAIKPTVQTKPQDRAVSRTYSKWLVGTVVLGLLGFVIAASVIFVQLPNGTTLRVEINDPEIEVAVKGTEIVLRKEGQTATTINPGMKTLVVSKGPGFRFVVDKLVVQEGKETTVLVTFVDDKVDVKQGDRTLHVEPVPISSSQDDADRAFATWTDGPGRMLTLQLADEQVQLKNNEKLPTKPFEVVSVVFHAHHGREATRADFDRLLTANLKHVQTVGFQYQQPKVEWIETLHKAMPDLAGLQFATRDEYFDVVSKFENLGSLQVTGTADKWAEMLSHKPTLTNLYIQNPLSKQGYEHLAKLPKLTSLRLTGLTDDSINGLTKIRTLSHLIFDAPRHTWQVSDESLLELAKLERLESLLFQRPGTVDPTPLGKLLPKCEITYVKDGELKTVPNGSTQRPNAPTFAGPSWQRGSSTEALLGLVPAPRQFGDIGRWQMRIVDGRPGIAKWCPDGKLVAVQISGMIEVIDADKRRRAFVLPSGEFEWSPNGEWIAVLQSEKSIVQFFRSDGSPSEMEQGEVFYKTVPNANRFRWSSTSDAIALLGGACEIISPTVGKLASLTTDTEVRDAQWTADGQHLVTCSGSELQRWDRNGKAVGSMTTHKVVSRIMLHPDDKHVLTLADGEVDCQSLLSEPLKNVSHVAWSPDKKQLAVASGGEIQLLDSGMKPVRMLKTGAAVLVHFVWRPDSSGLVTMSSDGKTRYVSVEDGNVATLDVRIDWNKKEHFKRYFDWNRDGTRLIVTLFSEGLFKFEGQTPTKLNMDLLPGYGTHFGAWSPDGTRFVLPRTILGTLQMYDADGKALASLTKEQGRILSSKFAPEGERIGLLVTDGETCYFQTYSVAGEQLTSVATPGASYFDWHPDGEHVMYGAENKFLRILNLKSKKVVAETAVDMTLRHGRTTAALEPKKGDVVVAVTKSDCFLWRWKVDAVPRTKFENPLGYEASTVSWSPVGERMLITSGNGIPALMAPDGELIARLTQAKNNAAHRWSQDGRYLLSYHQRLGSNTAIFTRDGELKMQAESSDVSLIGVSPDGKEFTNRWTLDGKPFHPYEANESAVGMETPDGKLLVHANGSQLRIWSTKTKQVQMVLRLLASGQSIAITGAGQVSRASDPSASEKLVYVVEERDGRETPMDQSQFYERVGLELSSD